MRVERSPSEPRILAVVHCRRGDHQLLLLDLGGGEISRAPIGAAPCEPWDLGIGSFADGKGWVRAPFGDRSPFARIEAATGGAIEIGAPVPAVPGQRPLDLAAARIEDDGALIVLEQPHLHQLHEGSGWQTRELPGGVSISDATLTPDGTIWAAGEIPSGSFDVADTPFLARASAGRETWEPVALSLTWWSKKRVALALCEIQSIERVQEIDGTLLCQSEEPGPFDLWGSTFVSLPTGGGRWRARSISSPFRRAHGSWDEGLIFVCNDGAVYRLVRSGIRHVGSRRALRGVMQASLAKPPPQSRITVTGSSFRGGTLVVAASLLGSSAKAETLVTGVFLSQNLGRTWRALRAGTPAKDDLAFVDVAVVTTTPTPSPRDDTTSAAAK
jgi:hypothetical protein